MKSFQILDCSVCYKSLSNILWIIFIIKNHWNHGAFYQLIVFESFNLDEVFTSNSIEGEDPDCVARNIRLGLPVGCRVCKNQSKAWSVDQPKQFL